MPDVDIESYLSTSDASTLQTGTLRKKSRDLKLWKIRKYSIRSDSTCITYNEKKNIPTDIINITCVRVKQGSNENLDKSGSTDFSETPGVCLVVDAVNYGNLEIVLDSAGEAEEFVFAICSTAKAIDVSGLARSMNWQRVLEIATKKSSQNGSLMICGDSPKCEGTRVLQSSKFIKRSSLRNKQVWKTREYDIRSDGMLTYKNRIGRSDRNNTIGAFVTRVEVQVMESSGATTVNALEIEMPREGGRKLTIAFNAESPTENQKQVDIFLAILRQSCGAVVVNSTHCPSPPTVSKPAKLAALARGEDSDDEQDEQQNMVRMSINEHLSDNEDEDGDEKREGAEGALAAKKKPKSSSLATLMVTLLAVLVVGVAILVSNRL